MEMKRWVAVALVLFVCIGYSYVSARKAKTIEEIKNQLEKLTNDYEVNRMEILQNGESEQDIRHALYELEQSFTRKKNILTEQLNRKIKKKRKTKEQNKLEREAERTKIKVLKRKH